MNRLPHAIWIGVLAYTIVRLITDFTSGRLIWERPLKTLLVEVAGTIMLAWAVLELVVYLIRRFNRRPACGSLSKRFVAEVLTVVGCVFLLSNTLSLPFMALTDDGLQVHDFIIHNFTTQFLVLLGFISYRARYYISRYVEKLARQNLETELKFLKAQINPHFLFNALNGIYFMVEEHPEASQEAIERLSQILRYQLYECNAERVLLRRELQYLQDYIELERMRKGDKLSLQVWLQPPGNGLAIAPFLLQPLIENAFKHLGGEQPFIHIENSIEPDGQLYFQVRNSICNLPNKKPGGIGLENLKRRLELLYPGQHELSIHSNTRAFAAGLKMKLGHGH